MKTPAFGSRLLCTISALALSTASTLAAADQVLQKVPPLTVEQAPSYPENLARHHLGAQLQATSLSKASGEETAAETALLSGDPAAAYALPAGKTTLLVSLPKIENIGSISFVNKGVKGSVAISTANAKLAPDSPQWHAAHQQELSNDGVQAKVGPSEAKYVRLTFDVNEPGQIAGFGVYSDPQVSDFTTPRSRKLSTNSKPGSFGLIAYNYTDIHAKARALYVSSGSDVKQANNMIDDQTTTNYVFGADDASPTTVIDLGKPVTLRRLSAVYSARPGNVEFYILQSLPGAQADVTAPVGDQPEPTPENAPQTVTLNAATLESMKAVGSATDDGSQGRASIEFPETTGRYVMVRWIPAALQDSSFTVAEIAALGGANNTLLAANTQAPAVEESEVAETETQMSDGKTMLDDGKTMIDPKDMPGEGPVEPPGEGPPPSLPQPPPFTFVPVLIPVSP